MCSDIESERHVRRMFQEKAAGFEKEIQVFRREAVSLVRGAYVAHTHVHSGKQPIRSSTYRWRRGSGESNSNLDYTGP